MITASTDISGYDSELSITDAIDPPSWIARFGVISRYWYNPIIQSQLRRKPQTGNIRIVLNPRWLFWGSIYLAATTFMPFAMTSFSFMGDPDLGDLSTSIMKTTLLEMPAVFGLGICGMMLVVSLFLLPRRFNQRLDSQKPDPLIISTMSDSDIFYSECFAPLINTIGILAALALSVIWVFLGMLALRIISLFTGFPGLSEALASFGGLPGLAVVLACIVISALLLTFYCVLTVGFYSSAIPSYWAAPASVLDIGIFVLAVRWIAISIVRIKFPGFNDSLFAISEGTPGIALPIYTFLLLIFIGVGVYFASSHGIRMFKATRRGLRG